MELNPQPFNIIRRIYLYNDIFKNFYTALTLKAEPLPFPLAALSKRVTSRTEIKMFCIAACQKAEPLPMPLIALPERVTSCTEIKTFCIVTPNPYSKPSMISLTRALSEQAAIATQLSLVITNASSSLYISSGV